MKRSFLLTLLCCCLVVLFGCEKEVKEKPDDGAVIYTIGSLYLSVGGAKEIKEQRLIGKHYRPGSDSYQVISCVDFTLPDERQISDCNDSFNLIRLDSGKWVINGQVNGVYRWVEVEVDPRLNP